MKLSFSILFISLNFLFVSSCKKKDDAEPLTPADVTAPKVWLKGENPLILNLADPNIDPGATSSDDVDGVRTVKSDWTGQVNMNEVNSYTVTYKSYDNSGNLGTATREVKVKSDLLSGTYNCTDVVSGSGNLINDGTRYYVLTVTQSTDEYNKIIMTNLGGYGNSVVLYARINGSLITIPSQTKEALPNDLNFWGTATYNGADKKITSINYKTNGAGNGVVTLVKQ